jgi:FtsP/CotA-like multicopper oxidase with cupredoxin domain
VHWHGLILPEEMGGMNNSDRSSNGMGDMSSMMGFLGQQIFVNGKPNFTLAAATRVYRLRILNGSNAHEDAGMMRNYRVHV